MSNKVANTLLSLATIIALGGGLLSCVYYYKTINISAEKGESSSLTVEPDSSSKLDDSTDSSISADKWRITSAKGTSPLNLTLTSGILYGSVDDATYTGKGVASFDIDDFLVSNGAVSIDYSGGQTANENDDGYLSASDWSNFNNKQDTLSFNDNDFTVALNSISIDYSNGQTASSILKGFLSSTDWSTFNSKQGALTFGDLTVASNKIALVGTGTNALIGAGLSLDVTEGNITHNSLGGLTTGDAHTQYLLLAGRVGGQNVTNSLGIVGSVDAPQLKITANATQSNTNPLLIAYKSDGVTELLRVHSDDTLNLFVGTNTGRVNTVTANACSYTTEGVGNTFIGSNSGYSNNVGCANTGIGYKSLYSNIGGHSNTALGVESLWGNTSGTNNVALGMGAMEHNLTGSKNVSNGYAALYTNTAGSENVAVGYNALLLSTVSGNTALGYNSLSSSTSGTRNTALGHSTMLGNISGGSNTVAGYEALYSNTTGSSNTAFGYNAGKGTWTASNLSNNSLFGYQAGYGLLTGGNNNVLFGFGAGDNITTGQNNIVIGYSIDSPTAINSYTLNIGNMVFGTGLNGTGTTIPAGGNIGIGTSSPNFRFDVSGGSIRIEGTDRLYFGGTEAGDTAGNIYHDGTDFVISDTIKPTGYLSSDGTAGATSTVTVKGSDGANCTLTYKNGLYTATTCP